MNTTAINALNKSTMTRSAKSEKGRKFKTFSKAICQPFRLRHSHYIFTNKMKMNTLLAFTLRISLTMPFSSGMSSFLTSINSNLTFALRLSWNTAPLTEPSSIFYSWEHLLQNVQFSTCILLYIFQHCSINIIFSLNWREKGVLLSPYNSTRYFPIDSSLCLYILVTA